MAELDPRTALEQARAMKRYVESFDGQKWGGVAESVDRQNLAVALDNLLETAAMLMNMAGRAAASPPAPAGQAEGAPITDERAHEILRKAAKLTDDWAERLNTEPTEAQCSGKELAYILRELATQAERQAGEEGSHAN